MSGTKFKRDYNAWQNYLKAREIMNASVDEDYLQDSEFKECIREVITSKDPECNYYVARDLLKSSHDMEDSLQAVLASGIPEWNYKCVKFLLSKSGLTQEEKSSLVIRHAEVIFASNNLQYILKLFDVIQNKPAYTDYIRSKSSVSYYFELYRKELEEIRLREEKNRQEFEKMLEVPVMSENYATYIYTDDSVEEKSQKILATNNPEYNYYAARDLGVNMDEHLKVVLNSNDPYYNYKCVKFIVSRGSMDSAERNARAIKHAEVVFASGDEEVMEKLFIFLRYKPAYQEFIEGVRKK